MTEGTKEQQAIAALIAACLKEENLADSILKTALEELSIKFGNGEADIKFGELFTEIGRQAQHLGTMYPIYLDRVDFPLGAEFTARILKRIDLADLTWASGYKNILYPGMIVPLIVATIPHDQEDETFLLICGTTVGLPLKRWKKLIDPPEGEEPSVLIWATE